MTDIEDVKLHIMDSPSAADNTSSGPSANDNAAVPKQLVEEKQEDDEILDSLLVSPHEFAKQVSSANSLPNDHVLAHLQGLIKQQQANEIENQKEEQRRSKLSKNMQQLSTERKSNHSSGHSNGVAVAATTTTTTTTPTATTPDVALEPLLLVTREQSPVYQRDMFPFPMPKQSTVETAVRENPGAWVWVSEPVSKILLDYEHGKDARLLQRRKSLFEPILEPLDHIFRPVHRAVVSWFALQNTRFISFMNPAGASSTNVGAVVNLSNSIVGAGILGLALFFQGAGYILGTILLISMAAVLSYTAQLIIQVGVRENVDSYAQATYVVLGRRFGTLLQVLTILGNVGALIAYVILIGDFIEVVASQFIAKEDIWRRTWTLVICALVVLPLCLKRELNSLANVSLLSMIFVFNLILFLLASCSEQIDQNKGLAPSIHAGPTSAKDFFQTLPIIVFSFACHTAVFPVFTDMQKCRAKDFNKVRKTSFLLCGSAYFVVGLLSYLVFGSDSSGNILENFGSLSKSDNPAILDGSLSPLSDGMERYLIAATIMFASSVVFTFPLVHYTLRIALHYLLFGAASTTNMQRWGETMGVVVPCCVVGVLLTDVGLVFGLAGALSSSFVALIAPAMLYLKSAKTEKTKLGVFAARAIVAFGCIMGALGVIFSILSEIDK